MFGDESRFVFEMGEDGLTAFYILQILNASPAPVQTAGSRWLSNCPRMRAVRRSSRARPNRRQSAGREVKIAGPFAPGATLVQVAYTLPFGDANLDIEQPLPLPLRHLAVVAQKVGDIRLASPQIAEQRDMPAEGNTISPAAAAPCRRERCCA